MKDPTRLEDNSGVQIVQSDDGKKVWLGQPTIIKSLESCKEENDYYTWNTRIYWWRWMIFQRWMRKQNPCTGQEWDIVVSHQAQ